MNVRGFSRSAAPTVDGSYWTVPDEITLRAFWLNDPSADNEELGANVFMIADELMDQYSPVDGRYRFVAEPPPAGARAELEASLDRISLELAEPPPYRPWRISSAASTGRDGLGRAALHARIRRSLRGHPSGLSCTSGRTAPFQSRGSSIRLMSPRPWRRAAAKPERRPCAQP